MPKPSQLMLVLQPGSKCVIGTDLPGLVRGVWLDGETIKYEVVWWSGKDHKKDWFREIEVASDEDAEQLTIGFHADKHGCKSHAQ